ncbi:MAG: hypothetical protein ACXVL8_20160, partial [Acidimicrobiia bacterium]
MTKMTDPDLARRAAALAARPNTRQGSAKRGPRAHPAATSRIVASGLSATALFGLIAALTLATPVPAAAPSTQPVAAVATTAPPPKQVTVIIHRQVPVA